MNSSRDNQPLRVSSSVSSGDELGTFGAASPGTGGRHRRALSAMRPRLGTKIVAAMLVTAVIPLIVSTFLVGQVIKVSDSVAEGQARRLAKPLERAAAAYRSLVSARKRAFLLEADLMSEDKPLLQIVAQGVGDRPGATDQAIVVARLKQLLDSYPDVRRLELHGPGGRIVGVAVSPRQFAADHYQDFGVRRPIGLVGQHRLDIVFAAPVGPVRELRALGGAQHAAGQIGRLRAELATYYRIAFLLMFFVAVAVGTALSMMIARRMVKRVGLLVGATRRVARGDLQTQVQLNVRDELGELADAFNEMVSELRESRERITYLEKIGAWQEIARRLAHQIKNPLTPIQLALQQLKSKYKGEDPQFAQLLGEAHDIVGEEVDALRRLVEAFSSFAKLPSVQPESVDLNGLIDDFLKSHAELGAEARLSWVPLERPCLVVVDQMLIKQALYNIVSNAVEVASEDVTDRRLTVTIAAHVDSASGRVALSISDNGPGMDQETLGRAFDPYFTRRPGGTGLGLAIVKKIVLEHNGSVLIQSWQDEGTTLTLWLPLHE